MSVPLTESESALLRRDGEFIIKQALPIMGESIFWGMYVLIAVFSVCTLYKRGIRGCHPRPVILAVTLYMFLSSTVLLSLDTYNFMIQTKGILLETTKDGQTVEDKVMTIYGTRNAAQFARALLFAIEFLIGDAVVIWRTWILWRCQIKSIVAPLILWVASFACLLGWVVLTAGDDLVRIWDFNGPGSLANKLELSYSVLSLATNVISTLMIAFKAWQHRQFIKACLGNSARATQVEKLLALLVDSGIVYVAIWAVQATSYLVFDYGPSFIALTIFSAIGNQAVGLYPTLIIVLVELRRTIWDSPEVSVHLMSTLHFASTATRTSDLEGGRDSRRVGTDTHRGSTNLLQPTAFVGEKSEKYKITDEVDKIDL